MTELPKKKLNQAASFIEELGWLLKSQRGLDLSEIAAELRERSSNAGSKRVGSEYTSPNPNIHFLIGILPRLFQDQDLFVSNSSIAEFAEDVLGIPVPRFEKRSKYELIGLIVCETDSLSDDKLEKLVLALAELTKSESKLKKFQEARKSESFSWNLAIESLTAGEND